MKGKKLVLVISVVLLILVAGYFFYGNRFISMPIQPAPSEPDINWGFNGGLHCGQYDDAGNCIVLVDSMTNATYQAVVQP